MKAVDRAAGGYLSYEFPGDPDRIGGAGCTLAELGDRLRRQSRSASRAGAQSCQQWQGSASVAYANRNNQHVRSTAADGKTLDGAGKTAQGFASDLRRIQRKSGAAVTELSRLNDELREVLNQHSSGGPGRELGVEEDIQLLRRKIRAQETILEGLSKDLARLRKKFGDDLLHLVPLEMVPWYLVAKSAASAIGAVLSPIGDVKSVVATSAGVNRMITVAKRHRRAVRSGDTAAAARALKELRREGKALYTKLPGDPGRKVRVAKKVADTSPGRRVRESKAGQRVVDSKTAQKSVSAASKLGRVLTPVGMVLTIHEGVQDAKDGDGKDGIQGATTRVLGVGAALGAPMVQFGKHPYVVIAGGVLVGAHVAWKAGMSAWDKSRDFKRIPPFKDDTRNQRMRLFLLEKRYGIQPDPSNTAHRRYVEIGGPVPSREEQPSAPWRTNDPAARVP